MARQFNLFKSIISQIGQNVKNEDKEIFEVKKIGNPVKVINILVEEGCFKIDSIENKGYIYEIRYKDLNLNSQRLRHLLRWDKSINKDTYNDLVRYDDYECHSYSKDALTEYDGAYCADTSIYYPDADCMFDLYLKIKGYKSVDAYLSYVEAGYLNNDIVMAEYREWLEQSKAADYEIGEDAEEYV